MRSFLLMSVALATVATVAGAQEDTGALIARLEEKAKAYAPAFPETQPLDATKWQTNDTYTPSGDPRAVKGGRLIQTWESYPPTLRTDGPDSSLVQLRDLHALVYETLVGIDPDTLATMPSLATHWQSTPIANPGGDGKITGEEFLFRISDKARWADGSEVTADDVVATWEHMVSEDRKDPTNPLVFNEYTKPEALDKLTVRVRTKTVNWRLFLYFGGMKIFPAKYIRITGDEYLNGYQWRLMMGSGPYHLAKPTDMVEQESFTVTRRKDWWGANERWAVGTNNFDEIRWIVVRDRDLEFEKIKKGEIDYHLISKAQRWVEECEFDAVKKGHILKRKIFTDNPQGIQGFAFNMRKPPFDDQRVRLAFAHLFNREKLIDKLFFNQYDFIDTYFPGGPWGSSKNPKIRYNPELAAKLLDAAGWKGRDKDGWLVNAKGEPFKVTLEYGQEAFTRIFTVIKEDLKLAGIDLQLSLMDWREVYKKVNERQFTLAFQSYSGLLYPNPRTSWSKELADQPQNNNVPGLKNDRIEQLLERYDSLLGVDEGVWRRRTAVIRKIDEILFEEMPYALGWQGGYTRVLYKNKFGHPPTYFSRLGDGSNIASLWWIDPELEAKYNDAVKNNTDLPRGETDQRPFPKKDEEPSKE